MLRTLLLLLLLANAVWWGWSQGWLPAGLIPWPRDAEQREPERLQQQVHPERLQILSADDTPATSPTRCWQAGPFTAAQADVVTAVERTLASTGWPGTAWQRLDVEGGMVVRVPRADASQQQTLASITSVMTTAAAASAPSIDDAAGQVAVPVAFSLCD